MVKTMKNTSLCILLIVQMFSLGAMELAGEVLPEHLKWRQSLLQILGAESIPSELTEISDGTEIFKAYLECHSPPVDQNILGEPFWLFVRQSSDYPIIEIFRSYERWPEVLIQTPIITQFGVAIADQNLERVKEIAPLVAASTLGPPMSLIELALQFSYGAPYKPDNPEELEDPALIERSCEIMKEILATPRLIKEISQKSNLLVHPLLTELSPNTGPVITAMYRPKLYLIPILLDACTHLRQSSSLNCLPNRGGSLVRLLCEAQAPPEVFKRVFSESQLDLKAQKMTLNFLMDSWRERQWPIIDLLYLFAERGVIFEPDKKCALQCPFGEHALLLGASVEGLTVAKGLELVRALWIPPFDEILNAEILEGNEDVSLSDDDDAVRSIEQDHFRETLFQAYFCTARVFGEIINQDHSLELDDAFSFMPADMYQVDPQIRDRHGRTLLTWAAAHARGDVCKTLLERKADLFSTDERGYTSLHYAAFNGHSDIVKLLLNSQVNVIRRKHSGTICSFVSPANLAAMRAASGVSACLLARRAQRHGVVDVFEWYSALHKWASWFKKRHGVSLEMVFKSVTL